MQRTGLRRLTAMPKQSTPLARTTPLKSGALKGGNLARAGDAPIAAKRKSPRQTGFSPATKLAIRTRAGNGDPSRARCEATGVWLGAQDGEYQHIQARGMGGSRLRNNVSNGVLLSAAAHRLAESRDEHMHAMGFWRFVSEPPGPVMLHGLQSGVLVWLDDEGHYLDAQGNVIGGAS